MADALRKLAAEIEIRGRSEGVEEVAAGLRAVADAGAPAADAVGRIERATQEAGRAAGAVDDKYRAIGAGLKEVAAAGAPAARVIEKTTVETNSAERAAAKLEQRYDKVLAIEARRSRELDQLNRVVAAGTKLAEREDDIRQRINRTFDQQIEKVRAAERAQDGLNDELERGQRAAGLFSRATAGIRKEFDLVGKAAGSLRGLVAGALAGISFTAITAGARDAIRDLDEIAKKARALGDIKTAGFLQESRFAFGQLGFDPSQSDKLLGDFQRRVGEFRVGSGELGQIALKIEGGAEFARALKDAGSLEQQFDVALKKLSEMEDAAQRAALAGKLFGEEAGKNIGALADVGVEGLRRLRQEARDAGLVFDQALLLEAERLNDSFAKSALIIDVQWKSALVGVAPLLEDAAGFAAVIAKNVGGAFESFERFFDRLPNANLRAGAQIDDIVAKRDATQKEIDRELARLARANTPGFSIAFGDPSTQIERAREKIEDYTRKLILLNAEIERRKTVDNQTGPLEDIGAAAAAQNKTLQDAIDKRIALEARLKAAKAGEKALAAFDRDAAVKTAVAASGFTGDAAASFEKETRAALDLEAAIAKITSGYKNAGKAAGETLKIAGEFAEAARRLDAVDAGARARPVVDLGGVERRLKLSEEIAAVEAAAQAAAKAGDAARLDAAQKRLAFAERLVGIEERIGGLEEELSIAGLPARDYEAARRRLDVEREIAGLRKDAANAGAEFDEAATRAALAREQALKTSIDLQRRAAEEADAVARQLESALVSAGDSFWDKFVRTGRFELKDLARDFKTALLDFAISPLRQLTANLFGSIAAGFAGGNPAGAIFTPPFLGGNPAAGFSAFNGAIGGGGLNIGGRNAFAAGGAAQQSIVSGLLAPIASGFVGLSAGQAVSNLLGLKQNTVGRGLVTGAVGGAVGGTLAGTLAFTAAGAPLGAALGLGAAAGGPIGLIAGAVIAGILPLLKGKPSNKVGSVTFDPATGRTIGEATKDRSADALKNLDIARAITAGISEATEALIAATGGKIAGLNLFADAGNRNGIRVGRVTPGGLAGIQSFENSEAGAQQAIEAGVRLALKSLDTPFAALDRFIAKNAESAPIDKLSGDIEKLAGLFKGIEDLGDKGRAAVDTFASKMLDAGRPVDDVVAKAQKLAAVYESTREPVDAFAQRARDVKEAIGPLIDDMKKLGQSTRDLEKIQRDALAEIGKDRNDLSRQQLLGVVNPLLAQVEAQAKAFAAERKGAEEAKAAGAPVDLALLGEAQRAQILAAFNLDARAAALSDPAAAGLRAIAGAQIKEFDALKAAVAAGFASAADLFRLQTIQAGDRAAALKALPEADQLRLAGSPEFEAFQNLGGRIGVLLTGIVSEFDRFEAGLEKFRSALEEQVSGGKALLADYDRALLSFSGRGTPGTQLKDLRSTFTDLVERAVGGDRTARENLVDVGARLRDKTREVNASSRAGQADLDLVEAGIARVREVVAGEVSDAERQLSVLEDSREIQRQMRDILAAQEFDPVRFERLAAGLPDSDPLRRLALELAALKTQQSDIAGRAAATIAGTDPEQLFARLLAPANDAAAPPAVVAGTAPAPSIAAGEFAPRISQAANDAPTPFLAAARQPSAPAPSPLADAASSAALDDDILAELSLIADRLGDILAVLRDQRGDGAKHTDKLSGQLGQILSNQVRRSL